MLKSLTFTQGHQIKKEDVSLTFEVTGLYKDSIENAKSLLTGFGGIIRYKLVRLNVYETNLLSQYFIKLLLFMK